MAKNCVHSSSRRRSTRSTMAPPMAPKSKRGSAWAKPTTPSKNGDLVICQTSQLCAMAWMKSPTWDRLVPQKSKRKL